jgi:Ca2+ transporting ATPase
MPSNEEKSSVKVPRSQNSSFAQEVKLVLDEFKVNPTVGLNPAQVEAQRARYGKNEIPSPPGTSFWKLVLSQFEDLLVLILLGAAVISFVLALFEEGEDRITAFVEPAVILIILICNATVGVLQESNAEAAIERLKQSEAREAKVIRSGIQSIIHASELVPGDIIIVDTGDKVPADARLIHFDTAELQVDESMLTGESEAAYKHTKPITKPNAVNQDKRNMLFSGTLVVRGKGQAIVVETGTVIAS